MSDYLLLDILLIGMVIITSDRNLYQNFTYQLHLYDPSRKEITATEYFYTIHYYRMCMA